MEDDGTVFTSAPSSSSSSSQWKYDVFLSFSGEDTRKGFTDHLYSCLVEKGLITFRDDPKLEEGKSIAPELLKAIGESWCSIIVFSKRYALSSWCLDELVEIIKQKEKRGHEIYPVFYDVEPRELRKQKGSVDQAFAEHEKTYTQDQTKRWRDALFEGSGIAGWELKYRYESEFIRDVVGKISKKLCQTYSSVCNDLIRIDSHLVELRDKICFREDDVRVVGICGMGGIGKTTLARVVYNHMSGYFEGKCFLADVREVAMKSGLVTLQKQLLSVLLPGEDFQFFNVGDGIEIVRRRLRHKRVLVVIDDADNMQHFKCLAEKRDWFGLGSRIIITSRDEHLLLHSYGVDDVYKPTTLDDSEALRLLSLKAFKSDTPKDDFMSLSQSVVKYAGGLPLALDVLGSFLCGRDADQWRHAIESLKSEPDKEINNCLKISFDGLSEKQKKIFLDIAHFLKGRDRDFVTKILDGCGYSPGIGLPVLIERSLIRVEDNKIWMHDLLQEMGRYIVQQKSPDEPGKRCRLSEESDVYQVLTQNSGTKAIEGMVINSTIWEQKETFTLSADAFSKMTKLRLLIVRGLSKSSNLKYLSKELRLLEWPKCPLKSLPCGFQPDNLVALLLPNSCIEQLWEGKRSLKNLKVVNLRDSTKLIKISDFTKAENLESLNLEGCTSLVHVHPSIAYLPKLKLLNLRNCKSLETLILSSCSKLENLPDFTIFKNLESLNLEGCTSLVHIHPSIAFLPKLKLLNLKTCTSLRSLPAKIRMESLETFILSGCSHLRRFPEIAGEMKCLPELYLDGTSIKELPSSFGHLSNLKVLNLSGCSKLENLPDFTMIENLERLNLEGCTSLLDIHPSISFLPKLKLLNLRNCTSLRSLSTNIGMESLETLILAGCMNLRRFPEITVKMERLLELNLDGINIEELPSSIGNLCSLKVLNLKGRSVLESSKKSQNSMGLRIPRLSGLSSLRKLDISGRNLREGALPSDICCLSSLKELILKDSNIVSLPETLSQLSKLYLLELEDCKMLGALPQLPSSISGVGLEGCASLEIVPNPTIAYPTSKQIHYYGVNCFKLAMNDNALRMLKGHLKIVANVRNIFDILIPGSEIFEWFNYQSEGCSVMIPNLQNDIQWMGFALCCALVPASNNDAWRREEIKCIIKIHFEGFACEMDTQGYLFNSKSGQISEDHLWLRYLARDILENYLKRKSGRYEILRSGDWIRNCIGIEILFYTIGIGTKVNKCGARLVYTSDLEDLDPTMEQPTRKERYD